MENPYTEERESNPADLLLDITALRMRLHREREKQDRRLDQLSNAVAEVIRRRYRPPQTKRSGSPATEEPLDLAG